LKKAELAATDYRDGKQSYRLMEPRSTWTFKTYAPETPHFNPVTETER
jgi:hypothetical protein